METENPDASRQNQIGLGQKELISLIPLMHFLCSCVFIFGYARAFGYKIIALFSIIDVFQVSVRNVIQIYFIIIMPFIVLLFSRSQSQRLSQVKNPIIALSSSCILALIIIIGTKADLFWQYTPAVQLSVAAIVALLIMQGWWIHSNAQRSWNDVGLILSFSCYLLIFSFVAGVHVGLQDGSRHLQGDERYLACIDARGNSLGALYGRINDQDMILIPGAVGQYLIGKDLCQHFYTIDPLRI